VGLGGQTAGLTQGLLSLFVSDDKERDFRLFDKKE